MPVPAVIAPRIDAPATASWKNRVGHIGTPPGQRQLKAHTQHQHEWISTSRDRQTRLGTAA